MIRPRKRHKDRDDSERREKVGENARGLRAAPAGARCWPRLALSNVSTRSRWRRQLVQMDSRLSNGNLMPYGPSRRLFVTACELYLEGKQYGIPPLPPIPHPPTHSCSPAAKFLFAKLFELLPTNLAELNRQYQICWPNKRCGPQ